MSEKAAILIANGGKDPQEGIWIQLCINKILEYTDWENYHIYVWNNNVEDQVAIDFLQTIPNLTLIQADPTEKLTHFHAVPLQRLYELACQDNPKYIVTMDSDAHPLQKGWIQTLTSELNDKVVLAGVWRDELKKAITPYIHASCLCTTVDFIESHNLRLDFIAQNTTTEIHDTLSSFTETANKFGLETCKLYRSNQNNFHRLMGGIYGDLIYHHGAGSRVNIGFWDEARTEQLQAQNRRLNETANSLLFNHYTDYLSWLQGKCQNEKFIVKINNLQSISSADKDQNNRSNHNTGAHSFYRIFINKMLAIIRLPLVRKSQ